MKANAGVGITEDLMDARSLFLTPNTTTVYVFACLDVARGRWCCEVPAGVLGPVDDAYFRWVTDIGLTGPDRGRGGKYLFVPPGYTGDCRPTATSRRQAAHQHAARLLPRLREGRQHRGCRSAREGGSERLSARCDDRDAASRQGAFVNTSGVKFNTISANTIRFYDELNQVVQASPPTSSTPTRSVCSRSIGIARDSPSRRTSG